MTLGTPEPTKPFPTFGTTVERDGWCQESKEIHGEVPIVRAQLVRHFNTLFLVKGAGHKSWQIRISRLPTKTSKLSIRETSSPATSPAFIGDDRALWNGFDKTNTKKHGRCP